MNDRSRERRLLGLFVGVCLSLIAGGIAIPSLLGAEAPPAVIPELMPEP